MQVKCWASNFNDFVIFVGPHLGIFFVIVVLLHTREARSYCTKAVLNFGSVNYMGSNIHMKHTLDW